MRWRDTPQEVGVYVRCGVSIRDPFEKPFFVKTLPLSLKTQMVPFKNVWYNAYSKGLGDVNLEVIRES